jgi:hypothetical protein
MWVRQLWLIIKNTEGNPEKYCLLIDDFKLSFSFKVMEVANVYYKFENALRKKCC